jgi:L-lysine exporter family protein LysE/ArgO
VNRYPILPDYFNFLLNFLIAAFFTGFFLGLSLIVAIGPQNTFVLRQGFIGIHVFYTALFCSIADSLLIITGVVGISFFLKNFITTFEELIFGFSAIWLLIYGLLRLKDAYLANTYFKIKNAPPQNLISTLTLVSIITFANPHVYLDTMILIGSVSQQFQGPTKYSFAIGASTASFIFFFSLAYGAKRFSKVFQSNFVWRILDLVISIIMIFISIRLAIAGNWIL